MSKSKLNRVFIGLGAAALLTLMLTACGTGINNPLQNLFNRRVTPVPENLPPQVQAQLRDFDFAVQSLRAMYLRQDAVGQNWQKVADAERSAIVSSKDDTGQQFGTSLGKIITEVKDDDLALLPPDQPQQPQQAPRPYSGIGVLIGMPEEGKDRLLVLSVYPDSPADRAGLKAHDAIIAIEGEPVTFEDRDNLIPKLLGEAGTKVAVTVRTPGQTPREVTLTRRAVEPNSPMVYKRLPETNIGYIAPDPSNPRTMRADTANALRELNSDQTVDGLVLDLRIIRTPEFPLDEMLSLFVNGQVGAIQSRQGKAKIEVAGKSIAGSQETPMAILVSEQTSGQAEAFAGILQDLGRAQVVGKPTRGDIAQFSTTTLPSSRLQLRIPTGDYIGVKNKSWRDTGVQPGIASERSWEEFTADADPQLQQAIDVLTAK
jgi:carboxyl-terminal processing protease